LVGAGADRILGDGDFVLRQALIVERFAVRIALLRTVGWTIAFDGTKVLIRMIRHVGDVLLGHLGSLEGRTIRAGGFPVALA